MYERIAEEDGTLHGIAINHELHLTVFPDRPDAQVFKRIGIKKWLVVGKDGKQSLTDQGTVVWLVGRLNNVFLYCVGEGRLIMTTQELNP